MSRSLAPALLLVLSASLAAGPPGPAPGGCGGSHIVVRGDTLYSIARRCRSSVVEIARASGLADPRRIEVGQRLTIPGSAGLPPAPGREESARRAGLSYRFAAGDTLYSLARWARVSLRALFAANPGIDPRKIEIGDAVALPAGAAAPDAARRRERGGAVPRPRAEASRPPPAPPGPHRVHADRPRTAPAPTPKPYEEDERVPEGM